MGANTYLQERDLIIRKLKQELCRLFANSKATLKDIGVVLDDYIRNSGYTASKQTNLYNNLGTEYCELQSVLCNIAEMGYLTNLQKLKRLERR